VQFINTTIFLGLSIWIFGFALMIAGWLVDALFESYGTIPSKILYKTGAVLVAAPAIYLLWILARLVFANRLSIVIFIRDAVEFIQNVKDSVMTF